MTLCLYRLHDNGRVYMISNSIYEQDFQQWVEQHITLLKMGRLQELDIEHLIEELENMARRDKHELINHLIILLAHLLKWEFQLQQLSEMWGTYEGKSWRNTILEQRAQINRQLVFTPSLKSFLNTAIEEAYPAAVQLAVDETNLPLSTFPVHCPYPADKILDKLFYPQPR